MNTKRMTMRHNLFAAASVVTFSLALSACAATTPSANSGPDASGVSTVTLGSVGKPAMSWPLFVGQEKGIFAKHNIELENVQAQASAGVVQQLVAGSVDIATSGLADPMHAIDAGAKIKAIASIGAQAAFSIIARDGISSWDDLKGKKVIVGGPKDVTLYYFEAVAAENGLKGSDFSYVYAGATPNRFAALQSGSVDAAILSLPFNFKAVGEGGTNLGDVPDTIPGVPFQGISVNTDWADANEDVLLDFLRAYLESVTWINDESNRDEAIAILAKETGSDEKDASDTYDFYKKVDMFPADETLNEAGVDLLIKNLVENGTLTGPAKPAATYVDNSYLTKAIKG